MQSVFLNWEPSPTPEVVGYNVHYGSSSGGYTVTQPAGNALDVRIDGLMDGTTYYFVVTAINDSNQESDLSNEVQYQVPGIAPPSAPRVERMTTDEGVILSWDPSPAVDLLGYGVYWGTESGVYWYSAFSEQSTITIPGLPDGAVYYFAITAITTSGLESVPSVETVQTILNASIFELAIQPAVLDGFENGIQITANGQTPPTWTLEASTDLLDWRPLITRSDWQVNVTVATAIHSSQFFRLDKPEDPLLIELGRPNGFPNVITLRTASPVAWWWLLESSTDLENWKPLSTGFFTPVNLVIFTAPNPRVFFRLRSE